MKTIISGDDIEVEIELVDENDFEINLSLLLGLTVEVCESSCQNDDILVYSLNPTGDERQLNLVDAPNGIFNIVLPREWTLDNAGRIFNFEITAIFDKTGDPDYINGEQHVSTILHNFVKIESQC